MSNSFSVTTILFQSVGTRSASVDLSSREIRAGNESGERDRQLPVFDFGSGSSNRRIEDRARPGPRRDARGFEGARFARLRFDGSGSP